MSIPTSVVDVPDVVVRLAGGAAVVPVWRNGLGGTTFRLVAAAGVDRFVRVSPPGAGPDLAGEVARLRWVARWAVVPPVLDAGTTTDGSTWLLTAVIPGRSAVEPFWTSRPRQAARGVGRALRRLHDSVPVGGCPFEWSVTSRTAGRDDLAQLVAQAPPDDRLVVCQGDACAPNTMLAGDGSPAGHVDLGRLGVADRWADLAPACWSADFNYGPGHADLVCEGYGVRPDRDRLRWYLALWDADDEPGNGTEEPCAAR